MSVPFFRPYHFFVRCPQYRSEMVARRDETNPDGAYICSGCGEPGHEILRLFHW